MEVSIYILIGIVVGTILSLFFFRIIINRNKYKKNEDNENFFSEIKNLVNNIAISADGMKSTLVGSMQYRGRITEIGLRKHFESWGWKEGINFFERKGFDKEKDDGSGQKVFPDFVINLPDSKQIIIDCKCPYKHWQEYKKEKDNDIKQEHLKEHVESVKRHIKQLSDDEYQDLKEIESIGIVLMYMSNEEAFHAAASTNENIILDSGKKSVIIVGPTTLPIVIALADHMWKVDSQTKNSKKIIRQVNDIYNQARLMTDSFVDAENSIENTSKSIQKTKQRFILLFNKLNQLKDLGIRPNKDLNEKILKDIDKDEDSENHS